MKLNRFIALAIIALLAIGATGMISTKAFAQVPTSHAQQIRVVSNNLVKVSNGIEEISSSSDIDTIQDQVGDQVGGQVEDGQPDGIEDSAGSSGSSTNLLASQGMSPDPGSVRLENSTASITLVNTIKAQSSPQSQSSQPEKTESTGTNSGPDEQSPKYTSSITVEQASTDGMSEANETAALAGQAKISVDQAKAAVLAANPGTTVVKAGLDNENGALVYSVELSNGSDVKVDAGNGVILYMDTSGDIEG
jgi:uncharacterized membrane protein YkoI